MKDYSQILSEIMLEGEALREFCLLNDRQPTQEEFAEFLPKYKKARDLGAFKLPPDDFTALEREAETLREQVQLLREALVSSIENDDACCNDKVLKLPEGWENWP